MTPIQARGEAEAELAYLNARGIIDAIITDDVDALVFGARTLIRKSVVLDSYRRQRLSPLSPQSKFSFDWEQKKSCDRRIREEE